MKTLFCAHILAALIAAVFSACTAAPGLAPDAGIVAIIDDLAFGKACGDDTDCTLVAEGDVCIPQCQCDSGAINTASQASYDSKEERLRASCTGNEEVPDCSACPQLAAKCIDDLCKAAQLQ